jgi:hypothetical protein
MVAVGFLLSEHFTFLSKVEKYDKLIAYQKEFNEMSQSNFERGAASLKSLDKATDELQKKVTELKGD